jgi:abortive infection bacteriophage resistance protein
MLFEYIGHIEIQVRTQVAYHLALNHGAFAHVEAANFYDFDNHKHFIDEYQREVNRQKDKSSFVKHNIYEYGELPIWVAVEIMSFGMLSKLYGNIKTPIVRKEIARYFGLSNWQRLKNWLEVLSYIRNACAHHQRLYNRTMPVIVSLHKSSFPCQRDSIFAALLVIKEMLSVSDPKRFAEFINSLKTCLATSSNRDVSSLGFPKEWRMILVGSPEST